MGEKKRRLQPNGSQGSSAKCAKKNRSTRIIPDTIPRWKKRKKNSGLHYTRKAMRTKGHNIRQGSLEQIFIRARKPR